MVIGFNNEDTLNKSDRERQVVDSTEPTLLCLISLFSLQLPLDTFYFIIKQYKERGVFPPGVSRSTKQSIERVCQMVHVKEGKLYSNAGRSSGRFIITGEKARVSVLRKAHARGGWTSPVSWTVTLDFYCINPFPPAPRTSNDVRDNVLSACLL